MIFKIYNETKQTLFLLYIFGSWCWFVILFIYFISVVSHMDSFTLNCQIILAGQQLPVKYIMHFNSDRECSVISCSTTSQIRHILNWILCQYMIVTLIKLYLLLFMNNSPPNSTTTFRRVLTLQGCSSVDLNHCSTVML